MHTFSLWAQSLDNSSPDVFFENAEELDHNKESARRQDIVLLVSKVTAKTKAQLIKKYVTLYKGKENFVLSIILPRRKDVLQREAPIICYGTLAEPTDDSFFSEALFYISNFVKTINSTMPQEVVNEIEEALADAKKKLLLPREVILVIFFLLLVLLLVLFSFFVNGNVR